MNTLKKTIPSKIEMNSLKKSDEIKPHVYKNLRKKIHEMKQEILVNTLTRHIPGQSNKKFVDNQKIISKINELEQLLNCLLNS